ncbi:MULTISPECIES: S-layer homology domain-containing protein [unclassified Fusibacter]|uniref:S-layer homology domain-containing protein n=1 Tax=unclassified Fusibacter TaxID=2624464 RepID=UPI001012C0FF|nr:MULTISPECIES: S-layer homology domain-containing protein [unclassified Fusibacter]MCK8059326.1 S-layer homology domain-containing protein [Fusibacter sp. A2]NPE21210.1 hypothetical protein [Fusibacter sp. A1]RXV62478.1 hypothetical protein DWB64_05190 [Fusibacter sp. A1]
MKRLISLILVTFMLLQVAWMNPYDNPYNQIQYVQEYRALSLPEEIPVDYVGDKDFQLRISQYDFTDVSGQDKINAVRLAMFDITKGIGGNKFGANQEITNIQVLTMLVRMFGDDQAIKQRVINNNPGVPASTLMMALYDAYYQEAKTLGILGVVEEVGYAQKATRENIGVWIVKASGIDSQFGQNALYGASDWQQIRVENLDAIETLIDQRIMSLEADGRFNPYGPMSRKEFAAVLGQVFEQFEDNLGLLTQYGVVIGMKESTDPTGTFTDYYIRNIDNSIKRIQVGAPTFGAKTGLAVYKQGLKNQTALRLGDEISYITQDEMVKFTVVLEDHQTTDRLLQYFKNLDDIQVRQGRVLSNLTENLTVDAIDQTNRRIRVELDDDAMIDLLSVKDNVSGIANDYIVVDGIQYKQPKDLVAGDLVTVYSLENEVLYVSVGKSEVKEVKGTLRFVDQTTDPAQIVLFDYKNELVILAVDPDAQISVNFYKATLADLKVGASTTVQVINNRAVHIVSDSYQPIPGYIPDDGKIKMATIQSIVGGKVILKDESTMYEIGPSTLIYKDNERVNVSTLKTGDRVKLYFDNIYSKIPSRVVIEGAEQLLTKVLKGRVSNYNQFTDTLSINNRFRLQNSVWISESDPYTETYRLANDALIYDDGEIITQAQLNKSYQEKDAYFVIRNNFGTKEIAQLIFKKGYEKNYAEGIKDYSNVLDRMELKNNRNIRYDEATIFMQENRLVDENALRDDANVFVVSNQVNGIDYAQLIKVVGNFDTIFDSIYIGALEEVNSYSLLLNNFSSIENSDWTKVDQGELLLGLSDDTDIYDYKLKSTITREELFHGSYSRTENDSIDGKGLSKERYYGIYITDGSDNVLAMNLRFKEFIEFDNIDDTITSETKIDDVLNNILEDTVLTTGQISEFNNQWKRIGLYDSYNFLRHHGEWVPNTTETFVELTNAIIMKNDKQITYDELSIDDKVYIVRYDEDALVLFVEP